ncbi:HK97 gp10 family phage protein [Croceibacterium sp. LX-88]|uniref:HK97 gp10 family phage protein n=1 Tax=Croceibacterium selenioxidans TaxID=2838833 RepID=A0ABS5W415_9SPHN|nr:HK97-gp10 family putative phage morphogenesis protein [Croceibacterium selenioxidans]MBT2133950.1 HK97 gp10 family phage protein [Croceibacterium selenioxidans]
MKGRDRYLARLRRLPEKHRRALKLAVYAAADMVASEAAISITNGAVGGKNHIPSPPGEPPNADTGHLASSIRVDQIDELSARVVAGARYAAALEFGTSKMAERPFMRPAARKVAAEMKSLVVATMRRSGEAE